jgi:hypothetical protein
MQGKIVAANKTSHVSTFADHDFNRERDLSRDFSTEFPATYWLSYYERTHAPMLMAPRC